MRVSMEDEDDDGDDWGVALSSGCCLDKVAQLVGNQIMKPVIEFVSQNITSPNWKQRYSALLSLGAITEGPDKMQFMNVVMPGLQNLISMFTDANAKVREALGWLMSRICEHHADVVSNEQSIAIIIPMFLRALMDKPKVANQVCCAIENLATSLAPQTEDQRANALTPYFNDIFSALFVVAYRQDTDAGVDLPLASFSALSALTEYCCLDSCPVIYDKLVPLLQQIEATINGHDLGETKAKMFQDFLAGLLQIMLVKIGSKLDEVIANNIVQLLVMIFNKQGKVTECGLIAYSGLCNGIGAKINVKDFGQYIVWALKGSDDECVRLACGLISDIADALKEQTGAYMNDFVPPLIQILKAAEQDRHTKL